MAKSCFPFCFLSGFFSLRKLDRVAFQKGRRSGVSSDRAFRNSTACSSDRFPPGFIGQSQIIGHEHSHGRGSDFNRRIGKNAFKLFCTEKRRLPPCRRQTLFARSKESTSTILLISEYVRSPDIGGLYCPATLPAVKFLRFFFGQCRPETPWLS